MLELSFAYFYSCGGYTCLDRRFCTALVVLHYSHKNPLCLETGSLIGLMITTKVSWVKQHVPGICLSQFPVSGITGVNVNTGVGFWGSPTGMWSYKAKSFHLSYLAYWRLVCLCWYFIRRRSQQLILAFPKMFYREWALTGSGTTMYINIKDSMLHFHCVQFDHIHV